MRPSPHFDTAYPVRAAAQALTYVGGMVRLRFCVQVYRGHLSAITCLEVATIQDREFIFTGSVDTTARMYNVATAECLHIFEGHTAPLTAVQLSHLAGLLVGSPVRSLAS